jgi:hypothetical protein
MTHWFSGLPNFVPRGHFLCAVPCASVLRGFSFESSSWSKSRVYITAFVQPLYIRSDHVVLSYGKRLGRSWELDERTPMVTLDELGRSLATDGTDFLQRRETPTLLAESYRWKAALRRDPHVRQLVAFSFVKAKQFAPALRLLKRLRLMEPEAPAWERAIASDSEMLLTALESGPDEADLLLTEWEGFTRRSLTLPQ